MQAVLGAGGGDVQKARGFDVFGIGVEVAEVSIGGVGFGAGGFDGRQKQPPARRRLASPLVRGANQTQPPARKLASPLIRGATRRTIFLLQTFSLLPATRDHL